MQEKTDKKSVLLSRQESLVKQRMKPASNLSVICINQNKSPTSAVRTGQHAHHHVIRFASFDWFCERLVAFADKGKWHLEVSANALEEAQCAIQWGLKHKSCIVL